MLPRDRIERDLAYLRSAVDKTAGPREVEAWTGLRKRSRRILPARTSPTLQKPIRGEVQELAGISPRTNAQRSSACENKSQLEEKHLLRKFR